MNIELFFLFLQYIFIGKLEGMDILDNQHNQNHIMGTLQWFIFLLANSIALPIVVGGLFHLTTEEIFYLMQRTFCSWYIFFLTRMDWA